MSSDGNANGDYWQRAVQTAAEETANQLRRMARLPFLAQQATRVRKGATPSEVVYEEDKLQVLHYLSDEPPRYRTPLLFVFALVNRPYVLDLLPGKSVVRHFVDAGFDTYLIDWGVPSHADRHRGLEDYVDGYLVRIAEFLQKRCGAEQASLLGYCMGGTMSAMFAAVHPQYVKNLMLLAAGIDFSTREGLINLWTDPRYFDADAFVDAYGNCPAEFLQGMFLMLNPVGNLVQKPMGFFDRMDDEKFVDEYFTMETWINDIIPVPGEAYRQFVKYLYQQNLLVKNEFPLGNRKVNLRNITCPVLNLVATRDDLVPAAQSEPINELVGSADHSTLRLQAGHIGLAVGSRAQRELWPAACRWLAERC